MRVSGKLCMFHEDQKMFHMTLKLQISGKCCMVPCNIRRYIYKPTAKTVGGPSIGDLRMEDLHGSLATF